LFKFVLPGFAILGGVGTQESLTMPHTALTETDLDLIRMHGHVAVVDDLVVSRVPDNPGYRWGNCLHLPRAPEIDQLDLLIQTSRELFRDQPMSTHVMLRWHGEPIEPELEAAAITRGMLVDSGQVMYADQLKEVQSEDISIRRLDLDQDWPEMVALNVRCDPEEIDGLPDYIAFKEGLRRAEKAWISAGHASWWGAFIDGRLAGQAGMVQCSQRRGRYQSVETHPDFRQRGVCSVLVSTIGRQALAEKECDLLLLGVNPKAMAIHIYAKLGFALGKWQNSLTLLDPSGS
jgi:GNAT superfamily N-acetyltransferase